MHYCQYAEGCDRPGVYTIPTMGVKPVSIWVCYLHRETWVSALKRRDRWPCAVSGCVREAAHDGLCEPCWVAVRGHDGHMVEIGADVEPHLRRLAVRHIAKPTAPTGPVPKDIAISDTMLKSLRGLVRSIAGLRGAAHAEYELLPELEEATAILSDVADRAAALTKVEVAPIQAQQGRLF